MLLWDVFDDWVAAAHHVASNAADEIIEIGPAVAATFPMLAAWLLAA